MRTELKIKKPELKTSVQEITKVFSESLQKWRDEEPQRDKGEKLFYCPVCSETRSLTNYRLKKYGRPKCFKCDGIEMKEYDAQRFRELRQRLADETLPKVPQVVETLLGVVSVHGFTDPLVVRIDGSELYIKPDLTPNNFRYNASTKRLEAFYYYYDAPQHMESLKALIKAAWRLGLGILVYIEPSHKRMPLPYDNLPANYDIFNGHEIKMSAEELWGFARGYGGL
jgi:transposase-like protein